MAKQYDKNKLVNAIICKEEKCKNKQFESLLSESPTMLLFSGGRLKKLCVLSMHLWPQQEIKQILEKVISHIDNANDISDTIGFYSIASIDSQVEQELKNIALESYELNLDICDISLMKKSKEFAPLFDPKEDDTDDLTFIEKALYDYLASSEDSSYLKNSLYYSLILLCLYNNPKGLTIQSLDTILSDKFGKRIDKLDTAIRRLSAEGHLEPLKKDGKLYLTQAEKDLIADSLKRTQAAEMQYNDNFDKIIKSYSIHDPASLSEKLRDIIIAECKNLDDDESDSTLLNISNYIKDLTGFVSEQQRASFIKDIKILLNENRHLFTTCLGDKFLELYRSDRYEQYINGKSNIVVLDTMVLIYLICYNSSYNEDIKDLEDEDPYFQRVSELSKYREENSQKVRFLVSYDYLEETVGELIKSLQLTWFSEIDLTVKFATSNIFYNYYMRICSLKKIYDERVPSFDEFLRQLGFMNLDTESVYFRRDAIKTLNAFIQAFEIESIPRHHHYDGFDTVKHEYQIELFQKHKTKSDTAVNSDIRLSFYLGEKYASSKTEKDEYYIASWDKTLRTLRKIMNKHFGLNHSYEVRTPGDVVQTLAFKSFHLNKSNIGSEVFAYANEAYGFTSKASSLFDNILNPYFASKKNKNTELVKLLLKLESAKEEEDALFVEEASNTNTKTTLEDFFSMIVEHLEKNSCGPNDLKNYLADSNNNNIVIDIFSKAFATNSDEEKKNYAYSFIDAMKMYIISKSQNTGLHSES